MIDALCLVVILPVFLGLGFMVIVTLGGFAIGIAEIISEQRQSKK